MMFLNIFKHRQSQHPPALFLHIPKTAGTSIVELMRQHYGQSLISGLDHIDHAPNEFEEIKFVSGHMGYDFAKHLMPGRFNFTFLRNPVDRILSLYYYLRSRDPNESIICALCQKFSLSDFLSAGFYDPVIKLHIWNNQVWMLARGYNHSNKEFDTHLEILNQYSEFDLLNIAKKHLDEFSFVGFTETFEDDIKYILLSLHIKTKGNIIHTNKSEHPKYEYLSEKDRANLDKLTELDWQLYHYARSIHRKNRLNDKINR